MKLFNYLFFFGIILSYSQNQSIEIKASLNPKDKTISIIQQTTFYNYSKDTLQEVYFHNWMNAYKNRNTPLTKRFIEDYDKRFYFAKDKERGFTQIKSMVNPKDNKPFSYEEYQNDVLKIALSKPLLPQDSVVIKISYTVKIPAAKFTEYGYTQNGYNLKYWYLSPVVYNNKWEIMHNYNMDDLLSYPTNYDIQFSVPNDYFLSSDLKAINTTNHTYHLVGNNYNDVNIVIEKDNSFKKYHTKNINIITNINETKLAHKLKESIAQRQIDFIENILGKYPHKNLLINKTVYDKNPVYGLNQLPKIFNPFQPTFTFDLKLFKALSNQYINNSLVTNRRTNYWLNDGLQTFLMFKYVEKYYPEIKAMGAISNIWGVRSYNLAKLKFNDKYAFVHQFAMRKNLDQALNTTADSLSTFNRKIVNKYKAGLGLIYLEDYLGEEIIHKGIKDYFKANLLQINKKNSFKNILSNYSSKDLNWFFGDYIHTNKKIDYTIKKVKIKGDSIKISIKNKSDFTVPISLYGLKNKQIKYKKWIPNITDFKTITIPKDNYDNMVLNKEFKYPEINLNNNWKKVKPSLFNRPLQLRFMKDIDNPNYNQLFYNIEYDYNYYDGIILGTRIGNQTLIKKKWIFNIKPTYGFKSEQINGSFNAFYTLYPKEKSIYKFRSGITYSRYNYAPDLSYQRTSPFISIDFKRKSLRDVGGKYISARYLNIKKEIAQDSVALESDNYAVLNIRLGKYKPEIIHNISYNTDLQISKKFSKLAFVLQYRKLRKNNTQIDLRVFAGSFIHNKTTSTFFDFSLNRPSDYLFDYNYFGRSEDTGFLSQQIIISEGGFKSFFKQNTANQWMISSNNSIGIWRWIELYGDIGVYKNKDFNPQFKYDSGIRLNFIQHFFEVYFPIQSSNGLEINHPKYAEKIRFVATLSIGKIYNFIKRGFY